jgi:sugar lactone lactonase YvrE
MTQRRATRLVGIAVSVMALTLLATAASAATSSAAAGSRASDLFPTTFPLPDGFLPEGIAIGTLPFAYFGSRADGDIFRVNLVTGNGRVISEGPGPGNPSVGMKIDHRGRLFVSGGTAGNARVVSVLTGHILASYQLATGTAFINDVVLTPEGAYFTDSRNAFLYHLPLGRHGSLPTQADVVQIPLSGAWTADPAVVQSSNGIARTPDGRALIVVASNTGTLFRVDPATGASTVIDLGGENVVNGDGLLLDGNKLYVVQNRLNTVAVVQLNRPGTSGTIVQRITDARFDVPTTIARFANRLYLPNARFGIASPETATYNAVAVPRP